MADDSDLTEGHDVDAEHEPSDQQEAILEMLKRGRGEGVPWGRGTPKWFRNEIDLQRQALNHHLEQLLDAGWIQKRHDGLYEFVTDPRE